MQTEKTGRERRHRVLHVGPHTGGLLVHEDAGGAEQIDGDLGACLHRQEQAEVGVGVEGLPALLEGLEPGWRQVDVLDQHPTAHLRGIADGLVGARHALVGSHSNVRAPDPHSLDKTVHLVTGIETGA